MPLTVYHYPGCSTCKKALAWLKARALPFHAINLVAAPPSAAEIERLWAASGLPLQAFFNTSGESYRSGNFKARLPAMTDSQKIAALAADGKLIKRPIAVLEQGTLARVLVGFREDAYASLG